MSDTPVSDAMKHNMGSLSDPHYVVDLEVAQGIERQLMELRRNPLGKPVACPKGCKGGIDFRFGGGAQGFNTCVPCGQRWRP
jgi:hypothetical protein